MIPLTLALIAWFTIVKTGLLIIEWRDKNVL